MRGVLALEKKEFNKISAELIRTHQQLEDGKIFSAAVDKIDSLIMQARRYRRTSINLPQYDPSAFHYFADFVNHIQNGQHIFIDDHFINMVIRNAAVPNLEIRRMILLATQVGLENNLFSKDQLHHLFSYFSQQEVLLKHIGEPKNQGSYLRAMALNILRMILIADQSGYFFVTADELHELVDTIAIIPIYEKDTRGFVDHVGWVHIFSALAGLYAELSDHDELVRGDKIFLMAVLIESYKLIETPLAMGENEDIADFLAGLFNQHKLYQEFFILQLQKWRSGIKSFDSFSKSGWNRIFNYRRLMQSLVMDEEVPDKITKEILND